MSDAVSASSPFARWTSILLHPFAVFAALALIAAWRMDPASLPRTAIGMAVAVAIVWAFVLQRRRSGRWGTVDASDRRERPVLYALVLVVAVPERGVEMFVEIPAKLWRLASQDSPAGG